MSWYERDITHLFDEVTVDQNEECRRIDLAIRQAGRRVQITPKELLHKLAVFRGQVVSALSEGADNGARVKVDIVPTITTYERQLTLGLNPGINANVAKVAVQARSALVVPELFDTSDTYLTQRESLSNSLYFIGAFATDHAVILAQESNEVFSVHWQARAQ